MRGIVCDGSLLIDWSSDEFGLKPLQYHLKSKGGSSYFIAILNYAILNNEALLPTFAELNE